MSTDIITIISSVGFPIVACVAMGYYVKYITDENRKEIKAQNEAHQTEMQKVSEALNNNTMAIHDLTTLINTLVKENN